ncbi:hypothetical protein DFH07DRAFT_775056 [Mycena maculata]|uniref:Uncharacterized protein n=1 Tax=Mycena maculata TaxID=230809 RepID=A0AAD7IUN8_9AGAR|nr:hypothetical protein DFH07DRAFT_775056 [Mycena maculata]
MIFHRYCLMPGPFKDYNANRRHLCKMFGWWASFVRNTRLFWKKVVLTPHSTPSQLSLEIKAATTKLLSVTISLDTHMDAAGLSSLSQEELAVHFAECTAVLAVLASSSPQWSSLTVVVSCDFFLGLAVTALTNLRVSELTHFTMGCTFRSAQGFRYPIDTPKLFRGRAPALRNLTVFNSPFPWWRRSILADITDL